MRDRLLSLLKMLEAEMRAQERWVHEAPSAAALRSTEPFSIDTLEFDQWLQWVFVPKLNDLLARQLPLPGNCAVQPMAEEVYGRDDPGGLRICTIVGEIDSLLSDQQGVLN